MAKTLLTKGGGVMADAGFAFAVLRGVDGVPVTSADASAGVAITNAPALTETLVPVDILLSVGADMEIELLEETTDFAIFPKIYGKAGMTYQFTPRADWPLITAGKRLFLKTNVSGAVSCCPAYYYLPA